LQLQHQITYEQALELITFFKTQLDGEDHDDVKYILQDIVTDLFSGMLTFINKEIITMVEALKLNQLMACKEAKEAETSKQTQFRGQE
jgi:hypothetical protein